MKNKKSENDKRIIAISIVVILVFLGITIFAIGWLGKQVSQTTEIPEVTTSSDKFNLSQASELNIGGAQPTIQPTAPISVQPTTPTAPETNQPTQTQPTGTGTTPVRPAI